MPQSKAMLVPPRIPDMNQVLLQKAQLRNLLASGRLTEAQAGGLETSAKNSALARELLLGQQSPLAPPPAGGQASPTGQPPATGQATDPFLGRLFALDPSLAQNFLDFRGTQASQARGARADTVQAQQDARTSLAQGLVQLQALPEAERPQFYRGLRAQAIQMGAEPSNIPEQYNPETVNGFIQAATRAGFLEKPTLLTPEEMSQKLQLARASATQVNVGPQGQDFGDPPKDFVWARNQDGSIAMHRDPKTGFMRPVAVPVGGGPEDPTETKAAQREQTTRAANIVLDDINEVLRIADEATFPTTGMVGTFLSNFSGTDQANIAALLETIRANVGFDRLQQMRAASPTGGALGQVSDRETQTLQAVLGNLQQSQGEEQFRRNLTRLRELYLEIIWGNPEEFKANLKQEHLSQLPPVDQFSRQHQQAIEDKLDEWGK